MPFRVVSFHIGRLSTINWWPVRHSRSQKCDGDIQEEHRSSPEGMELQQTANETRLFG